MFFNWMMFRAISGSGVSPVLRRAAQVALAQSFRGEIRDGRVVVGGHEAGAGIDVDRRETVDDLLAKAEDRQVALEERLLISGKLHPTVLKASDDLRARVEPDID